MDLRHVRFELFSSHKLAGGDLTVGMKQGDINLTSPGQIAFAPDGILLVADPKAATIVALSTGDVSQAVNEVNYSVSQVDEKIAAALGRQPRIYRLSI